MPSAVMTVHFPNGEREFRSTDEPPKPGDLMKCRGVDWIVAQVMDTGKGSVVVSLTPAPSALPDPAAQQAGHAHHSLE